MRKLDISKTEHDASPQGIGKFVIAISMILGVAFAIMLLVFSHHTPIIQMIAASPGHFAKGIYSEVCLKW